MDLTVINSNETLGGTSIFFQHTPKAGPFQDTNKNLYTFGLTTGGVLKCYKSTNDGANWTAQNTGSQPTVGTDQNLALAVEQVGAILHIVTQYDNATLGAQSPRYHRFGMSDNGGSADTWLETNTTIETISDTSAVRAAAGITVRSSGDVVVAYQGNTEKIHGTDYTRTTIAEKVTGWTVIGDPSAGLQQAVEGGSCTLGNSGLVHITYAKRLLDAMHTSLADGSSSFSTPELMDDTSIFGTQYPAHSAHRTISGNSTLLSVWKGSTGGLIRGSTVVNDGTPTTEFVVGDHVAYLGNQGGLSACVIDATSHPTSPRWIVLYGRDSDRDIYMDQNSGSGWGTDTLIVSGITVTSLSGNVYTNKANKYVVGVVYTNGAALEYQQHILVDLGTAVNLNTLTLGGSAQGLTVFIPTETLNQSHFRIRRTDNQGLNTAFDAGDPAQDTNATIDAGDPFRIRFKIHESGGVGVNTAISFQFRKNGGTWTNLLPIPATPTNVAGVIIDSVQFTNGATCSTELLSSEGSFLTIGQGLDTAFTTSSLNITANSSVECEVSLMIIGVFDGPTQNVAGDTFEFRAVRSGGAAFAGTYVIPTITVSEDGGYLGATYPEHPDRVGPIQIGDAQYLIHEPSETTNFPAVYKKNTASSGWREIDPSNRPVQSDFEGASYAVVDTILNILQHKGASVWHWRFDLDNDLWTGGGGDIATGLSTPTTQYCSLVARSDGDLIAFYNEQSSPRHRIRYRVYEGAWGGQQTLDDESGVNFSTASAVMGANDVTHIVYKDDDNGILYRNTLSATNVLGTRESIATGLTVTGVADNIPFLPPLYYDDGGNEKIVFFYQKTAQTGVLFCRILTNGSLGSEIQATTLGVEAQEGANNMVIATAGVYGTTIYLFFSDTTDLDIYWTKSENGAAFDSHTELHNNVTCQWIRGEITNQGGDIYFSYVWDRGSGGATGFTYIDNFFITSAGLVVLMDALLLAGTPQTTTVVPGAVSVLQSVLTLAGSAETLTVDSFVNILVNALILAGSAEGSTVIPGAVIVPQNEITLTGSPELLSVIPGAVSTLLNSISLAGSAESLTIFIAVAIALSSINLSGSGETLTVSPGAVTVLQNALNLSSSAETLTIQSAVSLLLNALTLAGSAENLSVIAGAVSVILNALTLAGSPEALTVIPGAISVLINSLTLTSTAELLDVIEDLFVLFNSLTLSGSAESATIVPGAVAVLQNTLSIVSSLESLSVEATVSILLNALTLAGSPEGLTVLNQVAVLLNTLSASLNPEALSVIAGEVSVILSNLILTGSAEALTVQSVVNVLINTLSLTGSAESLQVVAGAIAVLVNSVSLASSAEALQVIPGAVSVLLNELSLLSSAEFLSVVFDVITLLNSLTLNASPEALTVIPGAVSVLNSTLVLASSLESLSVQSVVSVLLNTLTLLGSAESLTISTATAVLLNALVLAGSPETASIIPGAVSVLQNTLNLTASAETLTIDAFVNVLLNSLTILGSAEALTIQSVVSVLLNELTLTLNPEALTVVPGAVSVLLNELNISSNAEALSVIVGIILTLASLSLASSAETLSVIPGAISVLLNELSLAGTAEALTVIASVIALLNTLTLTSSVEALSVIPGTVAVIVNALSMLASAETLTVDSIVSVLMSTIALVGSAEVLSVIPGGVVVQINTLTATGSAETITVVLSGPGSQFVILNDIQLAGLAEALSVIPGAVVTSLAELSLASSVDTMVVFPGEVVINPQTLSLISTTDLISIIPGATFVALSEISLASTVQKISISGILIKLKVSVTDAPTFGNVRLRDQLKNKVALSDQIKNKVNSGDN